MGGRGSSVQDYVDVNGSSSEAFAVNADGSVVVGEALTSANLAHAFRWTTATGMSDLGTLGGSTSAANGVSANGSVVVGEAAMTGNSATHAFRWTTAGIADLGTLGGTNSAAEGVSGDGNVVVGDSDTAGNATRRAFRWTASSGMSDLGNLGGSFSTATATNTDGSVVVGYATTTANAATHAYQWTTTAGHMSDLGTLGGFTSAAYGVSGDGTVVVGVSDVAQTPAYGQPGSRGFRWTQAGGMVSVDNWLRSQGVQLAQDMTATAQSVSADGNIIVGQSLNGGNYIARGATIVAVPGSTTTQTVTAGLMNPVSYQQSLAGVTRFNATVQNADMTINGDNSSPLYNLLQPGQSSVWTSGDLGRVYANVYKAAAAVGEIGVAYSPAAGITTRLSLGQTYTRSSLAQGGDSHVRGTYVLPEATVALGHQFYGTVTGYANWGDLATRRGYANGDGIDVSSSVVGTQTYGFRARLDWLNAYRFAATDFSPYVSFTRTGTFVGSYAESGGAFPAYFNGGTQNADTSRVGSDAEYRLTTWLSLIGRAEYAHRFESADIATTGTILGLSDFDLIGAAIRQNWVRGAIGAKATFGPGEGYLLFNATSQTSGATYWMNANYRVVF